MDRKDIEKCSLEALSSKCSGSTDPDTLDSKDFKLRPSLESTAIPDSESDTSQEKDGGISDFKLRRS